MNSNQQVHLEYGQKMLDGREEANHTSDNFGGHADKLFGRWLLSEGLNIDPLTGKKVLRPVMAACLWAAEDIDRVRRYAKNYPRVLTIRGLHTLYLAEQNFGGTDPSVYVYRMLGPVSGELLEPSICKIGCANNGAAARVASQSRKSGVGYRPSIELELKCNNPARLEKMIHSHFKDKKLDVPGQEWFEVSIDEIEKFITKSIRDGIFWQDGDWIHFGRRP